MAKHDEVDPADESEATEPVEATDERSGSSTAEVQAMSPAESGEPGGTPERPILADDENDLDALDDGDDDAADLGTEPVDGEPVDEFDEIVRNSGVGDDADPEDDGPSENGQHTDAKVLEPAGVAATATGSTAAGRKRTPARTPKATPTTRRDQPPVRERTTPLKFVRQSIGELRKVVYPTGQQLINYFIVVLVFVLFVIAYVSLLDLGFGAAIFRVFS